MHSTNIETLWAPLYHSHTSVFFCVFRCAGFAHPRFQTFFGGRFLLVCLSRICGILQEKSRKKKVGREKSEGKNQKRKIGREKSEEKNRQRQIGTKSNPCNFAIVLHEAVRLLWFLFVGVRGCKKIILTSWNWRETSKPMQCLPELLFRTNKQLTNKLSSWKIHQKVMKLEFGLMLDYKPSQKFINH